MLKRSQPNIYERWYEQSGKAKILEAQRVKIKNLQRLRPKLRKQEYAHPPVSGLKTIKSQASSALKDVAGGDAKSSIEYHSAGLRSRAKTQYHRLYRQELVKNRMKASHENWTVGNTGANTASVVSFNVARHGDFSDAGTVVSDAENWAASGTWPSCFSSDGRVKPPAEKSADAGSAVGRSNKGLYERWYVSHRDSIAEAQQKLKQLKRSKILGSSTTLNAHKLKEIFERNHQDDFQDAIQGKKFTYEWVLEQESLIGKRLENIRKGLSAEDIDHDTWKYANCINAVHPWEEAVELEFDGCS